MGRVKTLPILFEDDDLIAVSKPAGVIVGREDDPGSLESLVSSQIGRRVFPYHRLDKLTTGIVLLGKRTSHAKAMSEAFENKTIRKAYLAVVHGKWQWSKVETFVWRGSDGFMAQSEQPTSDGKKATTTFRALAHGAGKSLVEALPKTGRTHQIRLHCAFHGCPIIGDSVYGAEVVAASGSRVALASEPGLALHAYRLDFKHPASGKTVFLRDEPEQWKSSFLVGIDFEKSWKNLFKQVG